MVKVISLIKDIPYLFNKLLFERYLYKPINFKITYVNGLNLSKFKRRRKHYFIKDGHFIPEMKILKERFD